MEQMHREFRAQGVLVVAAGTGDTWRVDGIRYDKRLSMRVPHATDALREALGVNGFPETLFIDRQGRIAERLRGGADASYFRSRIQYLLREPDDGAAAALPVTTEKETRHALIPALVYKVVKLFE